MKFCEFQPKKSYTQENSLLSHLFCWFLFVIIYCFLFITFLPFFLVFFFLWSSKSQMIGNSSLTSVLLSRAIFGSCTENRWWWTNGNDCNIIGCLSLVRYRVMKRECYHQQKGLNHGRFFALSKVRLIISSCFAVQPDRGLVDPADSPDFQQPPSVPCPPTVGHIRSVVVRYLCPIHLFHCVFA